MYRYALFSSLFLLFTLWTAPAVQAQVTPTMAYQGYVTDTQGNPLTDTVGLTFTLYDAPTDGAALWTETQPEVALNQGLFSVMLGSLEGLAEVAFDTPVWLGVRVNGSDELAPRLALAAVPYSLRARTLDIDALQAGDNIAITRSGEALMISSTGGGGAGGWGRSGNAGTDPATDFIGTTDAQPLEFRVNSGRALRLEASPDSSADGPNVLGGWSGNSVGEGVVGATIAGGGDPEGISGSSPNAVTADYGTIGGGARNTASGQGGTVGGGYNNRTIGEFSTVGGGQVNIALGPFSTVGGGKGNSAPDYYGTVAGGDRNEASGAWAAVGGGERNEASGGQATVGGGRENIAQGNVSTVPGGFLNQARGHASYAAGYAARAVHTGTFVWSDFSMVGDSLVSTADHQFLIRATGGVGIGTDSPSSPLTVTGIVESTEGGFQFPDGTVQTTAATGGGTGWGRSGNAGTDPTTDFIGTTDAQPLEVRVNGVRVLRLQVADTLEGPNVIGGWQGNRVSTGVVGATIAGGGDPNGVNDFSPNVVTANYGAIGGGQGNTVNGNSATVGGGAGNVAGSSSATVGGGSLNTASGTSTTIGGGSRNTTSESYATVGGGLRNKASSNSAIVGGGSDNTAGGEGATISGGYKNTTSSNSATVGGGSDNTASESYATVGGGLRNKASSSDATVSGGRDNTASGNYTTVGGGVRNAARGNEATVGGGHENTASGRWAMVPGGSRNQARGSFSFAAGFFARAAHDGSFVWNGGSIPNDSLVSTAERQFLIRAIGGVGIGTNAPQAAVHISADSDSNDPQLFLEEDENTDFARLRMKNTGSTQFWDIAAGATNTEQLNFFASNGRGNVMSLRATGDPLIMHNGARLTEGGTWTNASSRHLKADFQSVDGQEVLARLAGLPVQTWRYKAEAEARHMGPTAEAFASAFGLGDTDRAIATVDADGVALAAIQALYRLAQAQQARIAALETEMAGLRALVRQSTASPAGRR